MIKGVQSRIMKRMAVAFRGFKPDDATENIGTVEIAEVKALEAVFVVRAAHMSADQRNQVTNQAINILRTNNLGPEAEAEVRRIMGVE
jgi:hypothetical protein